MSWAGFWIKLANAPARVGLCVTTYLSIKTLGQETPRNLFSIHRLWFAVDLGSSLDTIDYCQ